MAHLVRPDPLEAQDNLEQVVDRPRPVLLAPLVTLDLKVTPEHPVHLEVPAQAAS